jgi:hypothetical protein
MTTSRTVSERVLLHDNELEVEVEADVIFDAPKRYWMAKPDFSTWKEIASSGPGKSDTPL